MFERCERGYVTQIFTFKLDFHVSNLFENADWRCYIENQSRSFVAKGFDNSVFSKRGCLRKNLNIYLGPVGHSLLLKCAFIKIKIMAPLKIRLAPSFDVNDSHEKRKEYVYTLFFFIRNQFIRNLDPTT